MWTVSGKNFISPTGNMLPNDVQQTSETITETTVTTRMKLACSTNKAHDTAAG